MIQCPNCGNYNYEENNFCGKCGAKLPNPKICPNCQLQSFENDYCVNCGFKLISLIDFEKMNELMDDALHLWLFDKDYLHAIRNYDRVLNIFPYHLKALENKGNCFYYLKKYEEAIYCFDELLKYDSKNLTALEKKGDCFSSQYKYDEAINWYNKVLRIDSNNQSTLKSKARALLSIRKYDEVPEILSKIKPERAFDWLNLSRFYLQINDFDNALSCLDNVEDERWNDSVYHEKSMILQRLGKYDLIIQKCDEKLKNNSSNALALEIKADCFSSLKKYGESINCLDRLIELNTKDNSAILKKVNIFLELKNYDEAKSLLTKIEAQNSDYYLLSKYFLEVNEVDESLNYLNKYLDEIPYFRSTVVDIYLKSDNAQFALKYCNKTLRKNPNNYSALCSKGKYYEYVDKFDEALECYDKAISFNKYWNIAYFDKIGLLIKLEKYSKAKNVLSNMKHENTFNYWNQLSKFYVELKDFNKALDCIDKTISLNYNIKFLVRKAEILYELEQYEDAMEVCKNASKLNSQYDKLIGIMEKINPHRSSI